jgi:hypothetical protein
MGRGRQASSGWHGMAARTRRVIREMLLLLPPPARELLRCAARRDGTGRDVVGRGPCRAAAAVRLLLHAVPRRARHTAPHQTRACGGGAELRGRASTRAGARGRRARGRELSRSRTHARRERASERPRRGVGRSGHVTAGVCRKVEASRWQ